MEFEKTMLSFVDEIKFFMFPDKWSHIFMEHSKNEILILFFLYKYKEANMTGLSDYIEAPLNTTTGVVNRLVKAGLLKRIKDDGDRRVVLITLTEKAIAVIREESKVFEDYYNRMLKQLTEEEIGFAITIYSKVKGVFLDRKNEFDEIPIARKAIRKIEIE